MFVIWRERKHILFLSPLIISLTLWATNILLISSFTEQVPPWHFVLTPIKNGKKIVQNNQSVEKLGELQTLPSAFHLGGQDCLKWPCSAWFGGTWNLASTADLIVVVLFIFCQSLAVGHKSICCSSEKSIRLPLCHRATSNYNILDSTYRHCSQIMLHCRRELNENK